MESPSWSYCLQIPATLLLNMKTPIRQSLILTPVNQHPNNPNSQSKWSIQMVTLFIKAHAIILTAESWWRMQSIEECSALTHVFWCVLCGWYRQARVPCVGGSVASLCHSLWCPVIFYLMFACQAQPPGILTALIISIVCVGLTSSRYLVLIWNKVAKVINRTATAIWILNNLIDHTGTRNSKSQYSCQPRYI
jgi:hypothetical protein